MEIKEAVETSNSSLFEEVTRLGHEQVVFCNDPGTGLKAIIAIHNTVLGPSLGGTRMWAYNSESEALNDVLRLSRAMTFKAAISGLNLGGGKAVIIGDARTMKTEALMRRFGKFINSLGGKYYTAEDVNMKTRDMEYIHMETKYVTGLPKSMGGAGDPSPVTAYGTYVGMKAMAKKVFGSDSLEGKKVMVQGAGQVGGYLVEHLLKENAIVYLSDIFEEKAKAIATKGKVKVIEHDLVYETDADIYSPCALGATLNDETIPKLKCAIIAGSANNQLADEIKHGYMLMDQKIAYTPDFLINSGGLINVYLEYLGNHNYERAYQMADYIYDTCINIAVFSDDNNVSPQEAAMEMANKRIKSIGNIKLTF